VATVSAIIPAYDGVSRYLEQAVRSVLAQSYRNFELIVVDDASTDDTARVVLKFPQARCTQRPENGGQAVARNDSAQLARGEFVAFLDQDDLLEPTFLQETMAVAAARRRRSIDECTGSPLQTFSQPPPTHPAIRHRL